MAPEQREGEPADERTDVFLLGATLYHLLSGKAPFADSETLIPPRQRQSWVPPALEAICLRAMQPRKEDRYQSAEALATDVEKWLADEPVSAYAEPVMYRLARWSRRHRSLVVSVGGAACVVVALLLVFAVVLAAKNRQLRAGNLALDASNRSLEQALRREEQLRQQAEDARKLAETRQQQAERAARRAREVIELVASGPALDRLSRQQELSPEEKKLLESLVPYYEEYAREMAGDPEKRLQQAETYLQLFRTLDALGRFSAAEQACRRSIALLEELIADVPDNFAAQLFLATCYNDLAGLLSQQGTEDGLALLQRASGLYQHLSMKQPHEPEVEQGWARACANLGRLLAQRGQHEEARTFLRQAEDIYTKLVQRFPEEAHIRADLASVQANLGSVCLDLDAPQSAIAYFESAVRILEDLVKRQPGDQYYLSELSRAFNNLAVALEEQQKFADAVRVYRQAVAIRKRLAELFPSIVRFQIDLAVSHYNLGNAWRQVQNFADAEQCYREAIAIYERLQAKGAILPESLLGLAMTVHNLGWLLCERGDIQGLMEMEKALGQFRRLVCEFPDEPEHSPALAQALLDLSRSYRRFGKVAEAKRCLDEARSVLRASLQSHPDHAGARKLLEEVDKESRQRSRQSDQKPHRQKSPDS